MKPKMETTFGMLRVRTVDSDRFFKRFIDFVLDDALDSASDEMFATPRQLEILIEDFNRVMKAAPDGGGIRALERANQMSAELYELMRRMDPQPSLLMQELEDFQERLAAQGDEVRRLTDSMRDSLARWKAEAELRMKSMSV